MMFGGDADLTIRVFGDGDGFLLALLPPGAFIALGLLVAGKNLIDRRQAAAAAAARAAGVPVGQPG
jgi:electron transport complex protein RnfE